MTASRPAWSVGTTAVVCAGTALGLALLLDVALLLAPPVATIAWAVAVLLQRRRRSLAGQERREKVMDSVEAMLGELAAGQPPGRALERAAEIWPELAPASVAHRLGADVPAQIREVAQLPGARSVEQVAAAWELCGTSGASLGHALEQVLDTVRADHDVLLAVSAELAAARATVRLIGVLPLLVLSMGSGIGVDPWAFLLHSSIGQMCLWTGVTLAVGGVMWLERIADQAEGQSR